MRTGAGREVKTESGAERERRKDRRREAGWRDDERKSD